MHIALALSKIANGESIAQISESLGYTNPSAFSAMFKRHLGKHLSSLEVPRCRYKSFLQVGHAFRTNHRNHDRHAVLDLYQF